MERRPISDMEVAEVIRMTLNWKAPGRDQIANFWLKQLTATYSNTHTYLATLFNKLIEEGQIPDRLLTGIKILIPKNEHLKTKELQTYNMPARSTQKHYFFYKQTNIKVY